MTPPSDSACIVTVVTVAAASVGIVLAMIIGIIVGTISLSGIGLKFSDIIISLSGGFLPAAILLIGLASLVLGMGVPVTAAYLITAVLTVGSVSNMIAMHHFGVSFSELTNPAMGDMSVDAYRALIATSAQQAAWVLIASHMIVYWFSQDSNITPPVCVAAYAGAAIAGSDPWKTGWTAFKFAKLLYVMPILFAFTPAILFEGEPLVAPTFQDEIMGAMVTEVHVAPGAYLVVVTGAPAGFTQTGDPDADLDESGVRLHGCDQAIAVHEHLAPATERDAVLEQASGSNRQVPPHQDGLREPAPGRIARTSSSNSTSWKTKSSATNR